MYSVNLMMRADSPAKKRKAGGRFSSGNEIIANIGPDGRRRLAGAAGGPAPAASDFGEHPVYRESAKAGFRTGTPFVEHIGSPKATVVPPEKETVAPADLAKETKALLSFMKRADIEVELHAAAVVFAFLYIHPFRDGNGRTHRMLACSMLSRRYSAATLLAFARARQAARWEEALLIEEIVQDRGISGPTRGSCWGSCARRRGALRPVRQAQLRQGEALVMRARAREVLPRPRRRPFMMVNSSHALSEERRRKHEP